MDKTEFHNSGTSNMIVHVFRLKPGDDLFKSIQNYVIEKTFKQE